MAKTIIQTIGPLYGEVVNGTVFGRPNGSVFVPSSNTINIALTADGTYIRNISTNTLRFTNSVGTGVRFAYSVAQSQDLQNYISFQVAEDADFNTIIASANISAGIFNTSKSTVESEAYTIVDGTKYYLRAQLMASSNVPVATSDVLEITGVAE